jgi:hypothetical protein
MWYKYWLRRNFAIFENQVQELRFIPLRHPKELYSVHRRPFTFSIKGREDIFKYLSILILIMAAFALPFLSTRSGVSTQEYHNITYAAQVYNYFSQGDTAVYSSQAELRLHPQFINNLTYTVGKWLHIDQIYTLNHYVSTLFGWLILLTVVVFLYQLRGWQAAFIGILLLAGSPRFISGITSDLYDSSFAFFYLYGLIQIYHLCRAVPVIKWRRLITLTASICLAASIHVAGFTLLLYLGLFLFTLFFISNSLKKIFTKRYFLNIAKLSAVFAGISAIVYIFNWGILRYVPSVPFITVGSAFKHFTEGIAPAYELFGAKYVSTNHLPLFYLFRYGLLTLPAVSLLGMLLYFFFSRVLIKKIYPLAYLLILTAAAYPVWIATKHGLFAYAGASIYLFLQPVIALAAALGWSGLLTYINDRYANSVVYLVIILLSFMPFRHIILNYNTVSAYFNELSGGIYNIYGKYTVCYNDQTNKEVAQWLHRKITKERLPVDSGRVVILTNGNPAMSTFFAKDSAFVDLQFVNLNGDELPPHDYIIAFANYIAPERLVNGLWLQQGELIHSINVEKKPVSVVLKAEETSIKRDEAADPV